jgi:sirohydrochlorin cobaltochelatase
MSGIHGLILFAHGARDSRWAAPFQAVMAQLLQQRPALQVRLAFLELMAPTLAEAGAELCALGCDRIDVLPMFLGTGGHLRKDLPPLVEGLRERHPEARWTLHAAIGEHDSVVRAMALAAAAVTDEKGGA